MIFVWELSKTKQHVQTVELGMQVVGINHNGRRPNYLLLSKSESLEIAKARRGVEYMRKLRMSLYNCSEKSVVCYGV